MTQVPLCTYLGSKLTTACLAASLLFLVGGGLTVLRFKCETVLSWLNPFWRRMDGGPSRPFLSTSGG